MSTFGNTSTAGINTSSHKGGIFGSHFTCPEKGVAESISVYMTPGYWGPGEKIICGIYKMDGSLVGQTEERLDGGDGWQIFIFSEPKPSLEENTDYILVVWTDSYNLIRAQYPVTDKSRRYAKIYTGNFPSSVNFTVGNSIGNFLVSIYCTYTPTPPAPPAPPPSPGPQPVGTGTLNVYAVADSDEVIASVQIVETSKLYNTPFSEYLKAEKTYTLRATYENQTKPYTTPIITESDTYNHTFHFIKTHEVTITSTPSPVNFTLDGEAQSTPFKQPMPSGTYLLVFPASWMVGVDEYIFTQWENGSVNPARTVTLGSPEAVNLIATYRLKQVDEAGPINQLQHKDNLRQVFGSEKDLSQENPMPTQLEPGVTIRNGQQTVATPGTAVQIGLGTCISVDVIAFEGNAGTIWIGNSGVAAGNGRPLYAGGSVSIDVDDLAKVYIDADNAGDGVGWMAVDKRRT